MSKIKYYIFNGDNVHIVWENEKLGRVLVINGGIDMNDDLSVMELDDDSGTMTEIKNIDLRDYFLEILAS
jgi:hypothetical protein